MAVFAGQTGERTWPLSSEPAPFPFPGVNPGILASLPGWGSIPPSISRLSTIRSQSSPTSLSLENIRPSHKHLGLGGEWASVIKKQALKDKAQKSILAPGDWMCAKSLGPQADIAAFGMGQGPLGRGEKHISADEQGWAMKDLECHAGAWGLGPGSHSKQR